MLIINHLTRLPDPLLVIILILEASPPVGELRVPDGECLLGGLDHSHSQLLDLSAGDLDQATLLAKHVSKQFFF